MQKQARSLMPAFETTPGAIVNWDVPAENFGRMEFGLRLNAAYPAF